jgi:hypothetical protein
MNSYTVYIQLRDQKQAPMMLVKQYVTDQFPIEVRQ